MITEKFKLMKKIKSEKELEEKKLIKEKIKFVIYEHIGPVVFNNKHGITNFSDVTV